MMLNLGQLYSWEGPHAQIFLNVPIVREKVVKFSQVGRQTSYHNLEAADDKKI